MGADEGLERNSRGTQRHRRPSVRERRFDLPPVADDARVGEQTLDLGGAVAQEDIWLKSGEGGPEPLAPCEDSPPRQPRLKGLETQPFEQPALVDHGEAPLLVVVSLEERAAVAEATPPGPPFDVCAVAGLCRAIRHDCRLDIKAETAGIFTPSAPPAARAGVLGLDGLGRGDQTDRHAAGGVEEELERRVAEVERAADDGGEPTMSSSAWPMPAECAQSASVLRVQPLSGLPEHGADLEDEVHLQLERHPRGLVLQHTVERDRMAVALRDGELELRQQRPAL